MRVVGLAQGLQHANRVGVVAYEDPLAIGSTLDDDSVAGADELAVLGELVDVLADLDLVGHCEFRPLAV